MSVRVRYSNRYCYSCNRNTKHEMQVGGTSHLFHLVMSILTMGFWLIIWAICGMSNSSSDWFCAECGSKPTFFGGFLSGYRGK
jgi:hypothetical protein